MKSAKREPTTARKTPSPTLAVDEGEGSGMGPSRTPCSSHGFDITPWRRSHHVPIVKSAVRNKRMLPMRDSRRDLSVGLILRDEVLCRARNAVIVGPTI